MPVDAAGRSSSRRRALTILLFAVFGLVGALILRVELSLRESHPPGGTRGALASIASPSLLWNPQHARDVTQSWRDFDQSAVQELTNRYLRLDLVFMLTLSALLLVGFVAVSNRRQGLSLGAKGVPLRSWILVIGYLVADMGESILSTQSWSSIHTDGSTGLERTIGSLSLAKWVFLLIALYQLRGLVRSFRRPRRLPVVGGP